MTIKILEIVKSQTMLIAIFFSDISPQAKETRKNKQMGLYQTKNLVHSKGKLQQNEKTTH